MSFGKKQAERIAITGMLTAAAFILNYLESMLPYFFGIPGFKVGIANIVVLIALYMLGWRYALLLAVIRIALTGFTYGSLFTVAYSAAGCLLSFLIMLLLKRRRGFSIIGISAAGGAAHNVGQSAVAVLLLGTGVFYYVPVLVAVGTATGVVTGAVAKTILARFTPPPSSQ